MPHSLSEDSLLPIIVVLFWGCWRSVYPEEQIRYFYSFSLFFLPDLLENWSFSGFNCLTFWHIICRADLYDCTGRECQLYEYLNYFALFSLSRFNLLLINCCIAERTRNLLYPKSFGSGLVEWVPFLVCVFSDFVFFLSFTDEHLYSKRAC